MLRQMSEKRLNAQRCILQVTLWPVFTVIKQKKKTKQKSHLHLGRSIKPLVELRTLKWMVSLWDKWVQFVIALMEVHSSCGESIFYLMTVIFKRTPLLWKVEGSIAPWLDYIPNSPQMIGKHCICLEASATIGKLVRLTHKSEIKGVHNWRAVVVRKRLLKINFPVRIHHLPLVRYVPSFMLLLSCQFGQEQNHYT